MDALSRQLDGVRLDSSPYGSARAFPASTDTPWLAAMDWNQTYTTTLEILDEEIDHFYKYILPTSNEVELRTKVVKLLSWVVKQVYPDSQVAIFGSCATGLYLPDADLDLVATAPSFARMRVPAILAKLQATFRALPTLVVSCTMISGARIPILKLKLSARYGSFDVDISFGNNNGIEGARVMNHLVAGLEAARPGDQARVEKLVYMIKLLLRERGLNETRNGGLGGMSVFLFVVSFIQMQSLRQRINASPGNDLLNFLKLYSCFDYRTHTISTHSGGQYLDRARTFPGPARHFSLQHAVDLQRDMTSACNKTGRIMAEFQFAHRSLVSYNSRSPPGGPHGELAVILRQKPSALGSIGIKTRGALVIHRANADRLLAAWIQEDGRLREEGIPTEIRRIVEGRRRARANEQMVFQSGVISFSDTYRGGGGGMYEGSLR